MALCPFWTPKVVKCKEMIWDPVTKKSTGEKVVPKNKVLICGRRPAVFLRAFYRELSAYRQREGKYDDVFGLCHEHGAVLAYDPSAWNRSAAGHRGERAVSGLRGVVDRVEAVDVSSLDVASMAREEANLRIMASVKSDFKRKMCQRSTEPLTVDHWRQLFDECLQEWVAESVMES